MEDEKVIETIEEVAEFDIGDSRMGFNIIMYVSAFIGVVAVLSLVNAIATYGLPQVFDAFINMMTVTK